MCFLYPSGAVPTPLSSRHLPSYLHSNAVPLPFLLSTSPLFLLLTSAPQSLRLSLQDLYKYLYRPCFPLPSQRFLLACKQLLASVLTSPPTARTRPPPLPRFRGERASRGTTHPLSEIFTALSCIGFTCKYNTQRRMHKLGIYSMYMKIQIVKRQTDS